MSASTARASTRQLTIGALLAALLAASAWVVIPIGAVPITLQVFVVLLAGLLLSPVRAVVAVGVYVLLGAAGAPVFSGAQGGVGVLAGPTGGYLIGFLAAAFLVAIVRSLLEDMASSATRDGIAVAVGILVIYLLGWVQLAIVAGLDFRAAFVAGVAPFVLIDVVKGGVAVAIAAAVRRAGVID